MQQQRRLAAILFTDIVGYTAFMQKNEVRAVAMVKKYHSCLQSAVTSHSGEILNDYGDGSLCSFSSAIDALQAAVEIQIELKKGEPIPLRIGLHIGEITLEDGKVFGDGINIASRIQSLGQANSILFSGEINSKIRNRPEFNSMSLGKFEFKNVDEPIEVFALTNLGLLVPKREEMQGKLKDSKKSSGKIFVAVVFIAILLIGVIFIFWKKNNSSKFTGKEKSIAVLPFVNMSTDEENEYFSDGMTEAITTQLSKIADLKVIARTSAMLFKNSKKPVKEIADELGVSSVLEGSVQKNGNQIMITAQLIDANTQENIWADKYVRDFKDVFAIQSDVAQEIASGLNAQLTTVEKKKIEKAPTNNTEAYQYYLQGNELHKNFYATLRLNFYENSKAMFEKAIGLDSNFAIAHAALADLYNTYTNFIKKDSAILFQQVKEIQKAWEIDSTNEEITIVLANIEDAMGEIEKGFQHSKKALELNPNNPLILANVAAGQNHFGLIDESKILLERLIKIDPLRGRYFYMLGMNNFLLNLPEKALEDIEIAFHLEPDMTDAMDGLVQVYAALGKLDDSKKMIEKSLLAKPNINDHLKNRFAYAYARFGEKQKALELASHDWRVLLALGKNEDAVKAMAFYNEPGKPTYTPYLVFKSLLNTKEFEPIRSNPDFLRIMEQNRVKYEANKKNYSVAYLLK